MNYCNENPEEDCAETCSHPSGFSQIVGAEVTLQCLDGFASSTGVTATCVELTADNGDWQLSDICIGISPTEIINNFLIIHLEFFYFFFIHFSNKFCTLQDLKCVYIYFITGITNYCSEFPEEAADNSIGPTSGFTRIIGASVTLTCETGYKQNPEGDFKATCVAVDQTQGKWQSTTACESI